MEGVVFNFKPQSRIHPPMYNCFQYREKINGNGLESSFSVVSTWTTTSSCIDKDKMSMPYGHKVD